VWIDRFVSGSNVGLGIGAVKSGNAAQSRTRTGTAGRQPTFDMCSRNSCAINRESSW